MIRKILTAAAFAVLVSSCATDEFLQSKAQMAQSIAGEQPGDYYIGRRFYRRNYFFWGYVRRPQQPWSSAQLVMLNEQKVLAPDREANAMGYDNNSEYRLDGYFSGQTVYEPASNAFYPEFVLTAYKIISTNPPRIFRDPQASDPNRLDRKSTRLNSSHSQISYAVFCLKKKKKKKKLEHNQKKKTKPKL